jgi:CRP-like cAMP-binding protein
VLEGLAATAGQLQEAAATFANVHHTERVRQKLLQLARDFGRVDAKPGVRIDLPITHDLLADMVGSARETVSRAVEELGRRGFVAREGREYRVLAAPCALDAS